MIAARILGWILLVAALAIAVTGVVLWIEGQNFAQLAGTLWCGLDDCESLRTVQLGLQHYLHPALWTYGLLPLLNKPAYQALLFAVLIPAIIGIALLVLGRKRDHRRRFG
jgi:uncharacterized membrane protein YwaF